MRRIASHRIESIDAHRNRTQKSKIKKTKRKKVEKKKLLIIHLQPLKRSTKRKCFDFIVIVINHERLQKFLLISSRSSLSPRLF